MSNINNLLSDAGNSYRRQLDETRGLVGKWDKTGLLEGIANEYDVNGMAVLLENQARQLIDENSKIGTGGSKEEWSGVALPLVRRIFSEIAAKDFVSVQPMNLPSGLVFYLDFKYGTNTTGGFVSSGTDIFGNTSASADANKIQGGLYEALGNNYSSKVVAATTQTLATSGTQATASLARVGFNTEISSSTAAGGANAAKDLFEFKVGIGHLTRPDYNSVKSWFITGSANLTAAENLPFYNKLLDDDGNELFGNAVTGATTASFVVLTEAVADETNLTVFHTQQPTAEQRGDFEDTSGSNPDKNGANDIGIPEIDVQLRSEAIVAKTRKLKAVWSPEFAQDLNAYHSIDAEAELTSMLSEYVSMEIDLEILDMLFANALTEDFWSATLGEVYNGSGGFTAATNAEAYQQGTWFQTLGTKIQKVSNQIHARTLRGGANFLVTSPEVATILESIPGYAADTDGTAMGKTGFAMGVQKVGALNNRFTVYKNPYFQRNAILMGYRGTQFLETGAVYAPYIPLIMTPLVYDPTNFTPRKGVMTRYAKKMVRPEFYGKVFIKGLETV